MNHRVVPPLISGEATTEPHASGWAAALVAAREPVDQARELARRELFDAARAWSARNELDVPEWGTSDAPLVMTGHQPELAHPGVWAKTFCTSTLARHVGGVAIELVLDHDSARACTLRVPAREGGPHLVTSVLAEASEHAYASRAAPSSRAVADAHRDLVRHVRDLPNGAARHARFEAFCASARRRAGSSPAFGAWAIAVRRDAESETRLAYAACPVTELARGRAFREFVAALVANADRFSQVHADELRRFRAAHGIRSGAHPVPDLGREDGSVELPFWALSPTGVRERLWRTPDGTVRTRSTVVARGPIAPEDLVECLGSSSALVVPRAATLTAFVRRHVADAFVHGAGGSGYEPFVEALFSAYDGSLLRPAFYATATLDLGGPRGAQRELSAHASALAELGRNPAASAKRLLASGECTIDRAAVASLAERLRGEAVRSPEDAARFGLVDELRRALEPWREAMSARGASLRDAAELERLCSDRTYAFPLFDARDVERIVDACFLDEAPP